MNNSLKDQSVDSSYALLKEDQNSMGEQLYDAAVLDFTIGHVNESGSNHVDQSIPRPMSLASEGKIEIFETAIPQLERILMAKRSGVVFKLNSNGLYGELPGRNGKSQQFFISSPLLVEAYVRDTESVNWGRLIRFVDPDGNEQFEIIQMKDLGDSNLVNHLRSLGLMVASNETAKQKLLTYLQDVEPSNPMRYRSSTRTGWQESGNLFLLPNNETIGNSEEKFIFTGSARDRDAFNAHGTVEEWRDKVAAFCAGNSRLITAVSSAFAACLLGLTGEENGGIHFYGDSSIGKSTTLLIAASVCGHPKSFVKGWRSTDNALEMTAFSHNDAILPLDEINEVDPKIIGTIAYMLGNGAGKSRMGSNIKLRPQIKFRLLFMSSGETTITGYMRQAGITVKAGQEIRFVDIPADAGHGLGLFENIHGKESAAAFAEMIKANAANHYGAVFHAFIEGLIGRQEYVQEKVRSIQAGMVQRNVPDKNNGQLVRVAKRFGLIAAGGLLATEFGLTGWGQTTALEACEICFRDWMVAQDRGPERSEVSRLIEQVEHYFTRYSESRFSDDRAASDFHDRQLGRQVSDRSGYIKYIEGHGDCYVVPKQSFAEICKGFEPSHAAKILAEKGYLIHDEGKPTKTVRLKAYHGKPVRMYVFPIECMGDKVPEVTE